MTVEIETFKYLYNESKGKPWGYSVFVNIFASFVDSRVKNINTKPHLIIQDALQYYFLESTKERLFILETPPRFGKSLLTTILAICYTGITRPKERALLVTASDKTRKTEFMLKIKTLLTSSVFLEITGFDLKDFKITDKEIFFPNGFLLISTTTQSAPATGSGFQWIWLDDLLTPAHLHSPAKLITANVFLDAMLTRTDENFETGESNTRVLAINQRLGFNDLSARFIKSYTEQEVPYIRLTLPYYFIQEEKYQLYNGKTAIFQENEFLRPVWNQNTMQGKIANIGEANFKTQYLQIATQQENCLFDITYLRFYGDKKTPHEYNLKTIQNINATFITVDLAFKTNKQNDFTAGIVWGIDMMDTEEPKLYILDIIHHKKVLHETCDAIKNLCNQWKGFKGSNGWHGNNFMGVYIEDIAMNEGVFQIFDERHIGYTKIQRNSKGTSNVNEANGKAVRANLVMATYRKSNVFLPPSHNKTNVLINEIQNFTRNNTHAHDDLVDCFIDGLDIGILQMGNHTNLSFYTQKRDLKNQFLTY